MRAILFCLFPCCLLAASPSHSARPERPPERPAPSADDGKPLPSPTQMERLAKDDPIAFLEACRLRYDREVKSYTVVMDKQERIDGRLHPREVIQVAFREKPFAAYLQWKEGARRAERALYVEGENGGKMLARPATRLLRLAGDVVARDVDGDDARQSGRIPLSEFGLKNGLVRTLTRWVEAKKQNALHVEYLGVRDVKEVGGRPCYVLRRTRYAQPEEDGITELTIDIDQETWLQTGAVLRGEGDKLIASYYFRDVRLNAEIKPGQFRREALRP